MNLSIRRTTGARKDIIELLHYFDEQDPNLADRFLWYLQETYDMIAHMPELGELCAFGHPAMQNVRVRRIMKFSKYLIFYRIEADNIVILRVLHGARDYANLFGTMISED